MTSDVQETAGYPRTYENYNSTLKHKLPLRVTFEMPNRMEQAKFSDGSLGCCYYESDMSRYQGWKLVEPHFDLSALDTAGVFHHSQQPAPAETFVPVWGPEWEYVTNYGTVFTFLLDDKSDVAPIKLACEFGDVWFSRDGAAAFGASWVIVSQRPRTPAPVETPATSQPADVPQWCVDAAMEAYDLWGDFFSSTRIPDVAAIIARHARANEAGEVERLKGELEREEREHGNTIDHRDQHENAINDICNALGLDEEGCKWSSHSYPPQNAIDRIERLFAELEEARKEAERNGQFELRQVEEREAIKKAVGFEESGPSLPGHCRLLAAELTALRADLARAKADGERMRQAIESARCLASKIKSVHDDPAYKAVWVESQMHRGMYIGPSYARELEVLNVTLAALAPRAAGSEVAPDTLSTREDYAKELDEASDVLQRIHPMGKVMGIGRRQVAEALRTLEQEFFSSVTGDQPQHEEGGE